MLKFTATGVAITNSEGGTIVDGLGLVPATNFNTGATVALNTQTGTHTLKLQWESSANGTSQVEERKLAYVVLGG